MATSVGKNEKLKKSQICLFWKNVFGAFLKNVKHPAATTQKYPRIKNPTKSCCFVKLSCSFSGHNL